MKHHALLNFAEMGMNHTKLKIWLQYIIRKIPSVIAEQEGTAAHPGRQDLFWGEDSTCWTMRILGGFRLKFGYLRAFSFGFGFECSVKAKGWSERGLKTSPKGFQDVSPCRIISEDVYLIHFKKFTPKEGFTASLNSCPATSEPL